MASARHLVGCCRLRIYRDFLTVFIDALEFYNAVNGSEKGVITAAQNVAPCMKYRAVLAYQNGACLNKLTA